MTIQATPGTKIYKLKRNTAPLSFILPSRHTKRFPLLHFDEEKNVSRALRYARNQRSPFEDDQDGNAIIEPVMFVDGFLTVPKNNPVLQQFMELHPGHGKLFIEVDPERDAEADILKIEKEVNAISEASKLTTEELDVIGRSLLRGDVSRMTTASLRRDVMVEARRDPERFLEAMSDPDLQLSGLVRSHISNGYLSFRSKKRELWLNTKEKRRLVHIGHGEDPIEAAVKYCKTPEGAEVMKSIDMHLLSDE